MSQEFDYLVDDLAKRYPLDEVVQQEMKASDMYTVEVDKRAGRAVVKIKITRPDGSKASYNTIVPHKESK